MDTLKRFIIRAFLTIIVGFGLMVIGYNTQNLILMQFGLVALIFGGFWTLFGLCD